MAELLESMQNSKHACCNLEKMVGKLTKESLDLKALKAYFQETVKLCESLTNTMAQVRSGFPHENLGFSTYHNALQGLMNELLQFESQVMVLIRSLNQNVVEPLEIFVDHYDVNCKAFIQEAHSIFKEIEGGKRRVAKEKEEYFSTAKLLSQLQENLKKAQGESEHSAGGVEYLKREVIELKKQTDTLYNNYGKAVKEINELIKNREKTFISLMESMEQIEESRAAFVKTLLTKHLKYTQQIAKLYLEKSEAMDLAINKIDGQNDLKIFLGESASEKSSLFLPLECVQYKPSSYAEMEEEKTSSTAAIAESKSIGDLLEDYFSQPSSILSFPKEESKLSIEQAFIDLQEGKPFTLDQKATVIEQLNTFEGRALFAQLLSQFATTPVNLTEDGYQSVLVFCNHLLTEYVTNKDTNNSILQTVLVASRKVMAQTNDSKELLYSQIVRHGIWQETEVWKKLIDSAIYYKILQTKEMRERRKQRGQNKPQEKNPLVGLFSKMKDAVALGVSKFLPGVGGEDDIDSEDSEILVSRSALNVLNQFCYYLSSPYIKIDKVLRLYRNYGKEYKIPSEKLRELELELNRCQPAPIIKGKKRDVHLRKFITKCKKYGKKEPYVLGMAVKFIGDKSTLRNLLLLNKMIYGKIKVQVFRQVLINLNIKISIQARMQIWAQVLDIKDSVTDYEKLTAKVKKDAPLQKNIDDIILMDVHRSFTSIKAISSTSLINILRTYAYYNPEIEYCQGMNFIVGYLYLLLRDEALAFTFLKSIIEKHDMAQLFAQNVPLLKKYFYQMDRLLYIHYPNLTAYFRNEGISASFFTSAWFITLFTYALQYNKEETPSDILLAIWDAFLLYGWKAVFKTGLFIIGELEDKLIEARFDQIMMMLGELPRGSFLQDPVTAVKFREKFKGIKISNETLGLLSDEYATITGSTKDKVNNEEAKGPFHV